MKHSGSPYGCRSPGLGGDDGYKMYNGHMCVFAGGHVSVYVCVCRRGLVATCIMRAQVCVCACVCVI